MKDFKAHWMLVRSFGGFVQVSFRPLFRAKEAQDAMIKANAPANYFDAPNHDEIGRMLLEKLEMAKILLRGSFNEDGYRDAIADPSDRETAERKLLREAGLEAEAFYYLPTAFCQFVIMEGDVSDLAAAEFAFMSFGTFNSAEAHLLITGA